MGGFLSRAPPPPPQPAPGKAVSEADRAVLALKGQRDRLKQYQLRIKAVIEREVQIAKTHLASGDKRRALLCLRKKKYQEQLLDKTDAQLLNLEQLTSTLEFATIQSEVFEGLKRGKDVLNQLNEQMRLEDVEKLMADTADAIAYQQEVDALLKQNLTAEDDDAVIAELDAILDQQETGATEQLQFPSVPDTEPRRADSPEPAAAAARAPRQRRLAS